MAPRAQAETTGGAPRDAPPRPPDAVRRGLAREQITGLVLAGGRGRRMGGADKGLLDWHGEPLARRALHRLAPQVGPLLLSANRHADRYAAFGVPVLADGADDYAGPLAGFLAGMRACRTPWMMVIPCDVPDFPVDLVNRLAAALAAGNAEVAVPTLPGDPGLQPVFCLTAVRLAESIEQALAAGHRSVARWVRAQRHALARFDDAAAFANLNTPDDLAVGRAVDRHPGG